MFDHSILKLLGLSLLVGLWIPGCGAPDPLDPAAEGDPPQEREVPQTATTDLTYQDITLTESLPDGRILWRLTATMAQVESEQASARLESVTGELFDPEGQSVRIRAQSGQVYPLERRVLLGDQVWVQSSRYGIQMLAEVVEWRADDNLLEAQEQVELTYFNPFPDVSPMPEESSEMVLYPAADAVWQASGSRLSFDFGTQQLQLWHLDQQPILAQLQDPALTLTALRLLWDPQSDQLRAEQQVRVEHPAQRLVLTGTALTHGITDQTLAVVGEAYVQGQTSGQQLWADRLDWIIREPVIEATGNVRYQQPGQALTVTGSRGNFNHIANTVAVTGGTTTTQLTLP